MIGGDDAHEDQPSSSSMLHRACSHHLLLSAPNTQTAVEWKDSALRCNVHTREPNVSFLLCYIITFFFSHHTTTRCNRSDIIPTSSFHHIEFYTGDTTSSAKYFMNSLGLELVARSDISTGNRVHISHLLQSGQVKFLFTAPLNPSLMFGAVPDKGTGTVL